MLVSDRLAGFSLMVSGMAGLKWYIRLPHTGQNLAALMLPLLGKKLLLDTPSGKVGLGMFLGQIGKALQKSSPALKLTGPISSSTSR